MSHQPGYFAQDPPRLGNQLHDDRVLGSYLRRTWPREMRDAVMEELAELGELAGGELYRQQLAERGEEPILTRFSPWGERWDDIEVTPLWRRAEALAVRYGLVATAYERRWEDRSRVDQLARVFLTTASTDIYSCPLAMTDGAARTLLDSGHDELVARAVPHLTSRDPDAFWTSGQWMTESTGGSDVGRSETVARRDGDGWRLWGRKYFTSATTAQMALTLARPEGNGSGGRGLALFYVETRDGAGRLREELRVLRLKDKLGTRKVPTAELALDGVAAVPVRGLGDGVRHIAPMLNVTRTWNAVSAIALMRRGVALARDYARRRRAFGSLLAEKPLHLETLAGLQAELEGAFHLVFRVAELLGEAEGGSAGAATLLRLLTPVVKLTTAKQAVAVSSEVLECFGGAGYVEDTGLPLLLRDAQVLPIWEGTTNVLALDTLRATGTPDALAALADETRRTAEAVREPVLGDLAATARGSLDAAETWLAEAGSQGRAGVEAGARGFALTLGRSLELLYLVRHAQWALDEEGDRRPLAAARRLARHGVSRLAPPDAAEWLHEARALGADEPYAVG